MLLYCRYFLFSLWTRDQQRIAFSLLISTHAILSITESTVLKFNYSDSFVLSSTLIYKYRLQWAWVQRWHQTYNIRNMFDSYAYSFRFIYSSDSNHSSKFAVLVVVVFIKKEERKRQQTKETHHLLASTLVLVRESYLFCDSCKCRLMDWNNGLLSMSTMSTSNFEYE